MLSLQVLLTESFDWAVDSWYNMLFSNVLEHSLQQSVLLKTTLLAMRSRRRRGESPVTGPECVRLEFAFVREHHQPEGQDLKQYAEISWTYMTY